MNKFKIISFLILTSFSSFSFAGAAEDRTQSIIDKAISSRQYSSASGHNYTVGGVRAANDGISADITQRLTVDGSSATVKQKVHIPANDPFYKNAGKFAGKLFRGGLAGAAVGLAVDAVVDGAGWVIDEGGKVQKKVSPEEMSEYNKYNLQQPYAVELGNRLTWGKTEGEACENAGKFVAAYKGVGSGCRFPSGTRVTANKYNNLDYSPNGSTKPIDRPVTDAELDDAYTNWFKNNPNSVTDPVKTYIYSPKDSQGNAIPNSVVGSDPSFGSNEITDEMMDNYLANRNAALVNGKTAVIQDSTQTETESNPDGTKTETKPNPDGSKTETKTETKTNPDTGQVETTVTETVINPDGTKQPSKVTETKTETKPNPETSKLPAACEYFAVLCDWIGWTKENPDMPEENPLVPQELDIGSLNTGTFQATAGCPADIQVPVSFGGASKSIAISYEPICALAQKWSFIAPLIGFISGAMILIGVGRKGEDGDS